MQFRFKEKYKILFIFYIKKSYFIPKERLDNFYLLGMLTSE